MTTTCGFTRNRSSSATESSKPNGGKIGQSGLQKPMSITQGIYLSRFIYQTYLISECQVLGMSKVALKNRVIGVNLRRYQYYIVFRV